MEQSALAKARYGWGVLFDLGAVAVFALLPVLFFWRFLLSNAPVSLPDGDLTNLHFPYRLFETREWLSGRLPLWNPYVFSGQSALGDIQYGVFYPLNIVFSLLLGKDSFSEQDLIVQVAAHFALAGIFTYFFARRVLRDRVAAIASAAIFAYSGYSTSFPVQQVIILETGIWLPLVLLCIDYAIAERSTASFIAAALFMATAILVGHPQTAAYVFGAVLLYAVFKAWSTMHTSSRAILSALVPRLVAGFALFFLMSFGTAAVQLLPSLEHLQLTERTDVAYEFVEQGLPLRELVGLLFPTTLGGRYVYIGIMPLAAILLAAWSPSSKQQKLFWGTFGGTALVAALGSQTFLHPLAYQLLPGFKFFRNQERLLLLSTFAAAMLSGYGIRALFVELRNPDFIDQLREHYTKLGRWLLWAAFFVAAFSGASFIGYAGSSGDAKQALGILSDRANFTLLLLILALAFMHVALHTTRGSHLLPWLAVTLIIFDLFSTNWRNNLELGRPDNRSLATATIQRLKADISEPFRIASEGLLPGRGNAGSLYEIEDIVGDSPLELRSHQLFEKNVSEIRRWQLLNVKYVLTKRKFDDGRLIPVLREGEINVYELVPHLRLPRAFIVYRSIVASSESDQLRALNAFDPSVEVVLSTPPPLELPDEPVTGSTVSITRRQPNYIEIETNSAANGILVLSERFYPGWKAFVDGRPAQILRANYLLRGIPLEAGVRHVALVYSPDSLKIGSIVSGICIIVVIATMLATAIRRIALSSRGSSEIK